MVQAGPTSWGRQRTCSDKECQRQWHAKKCREWNRNNIPYFQEIYLERCLESFETSDGEATSKLSNEVTLASLPVPVVQEVLSIQQSGNQRHSSTVPVLCGDPVTRRFSPDSDHRHGTANEQPTLLPSN